MKVQHIPVEQIRPEPGLGRKRDRAGHDELCRSIEIFGVLTPITVRRSPDETGSYLLVKGQGRTLACRRLGLPTIPAVVVEDGFGHDEKVQQFLVENVARLKMHPVDRALLIRHSRNRGEETADVAARFGVSATTVRRLELQLEHASPSEIAALRSGGLSLRLHEVISRAVEKEDRDDVVAIASRLKIRSGEMAALLKALGWRRLSALGIDHRSARLALLAWASEIVVKRRDLVLEDRLRVVAESLPSTLGVLGGSL